MSLNLAALVLLVAASQNPPAAPPSAGTARISGLVTRSDTNQPLAGVTIRLVRWDGGLGQQIPSKRTEADGRFTFDGLRAGEYALTFSADAFVTLEFGQRSPRERPAQQGTFRIHGLPPGNYLAVALPTVQGTDWQDPEFLQQYLGVATRVSLAEGETKTISLKLIRR